MRKSVAVVALTTVVVSCGPSHDEVRRWLQESYPVQYHELDGEIVSIELEDIRQGTTDRDLKVPFGSFPWDDDEIQPALTSAHRNLISSEIRRNFLGGDAITARVIVLRGVERFVANWFSEEVHVEFSLSIEFVRVEGDRSGSKVFGGSHMTRKAFDVSLPLAQEMYLHAISKSITECMRGYSMPARAGDES